MRWRTVCGAVPLALAVSLVHIVSHGAQPDVDDGERVGESADVAGSDDGADELTVAREPRWLASNESADVASPLAIQINEDFRLVPSLQYRLRYYHREGHDFAKGAVTDTVRHRARLGMAASYRGALEAHLQLQDVRTLGEETDTLGDFSADGFDLHQAYARLAPTDAMELRIGRQEIIVANSRLVGNVDFAEQGRSFDALRATYQDKGVRLDGAYALVRDYETADPKAVQLSGKRHLGLLFLGYDLLRGLTPSVVGLVEADTAIDMHLVTAGAILAGKLGRGVVLDYSGEGYFQHGKESGDSTVNAYLFSLSTRATANLKVKPFVEVQTTLVSGDGDPSDLTDRTFRAPYATGHKFHGEMDFFVNFPVHTQGRGLRDYAVLIGWTPYKIRMQADFHLFDTMVERADGLEQFGYELDFKAHYPFWDYASFDAMYGFFVPGEVFRATTVDQKVEHFAYATMNLKF